MTGRFGIAVCVVVTSVSIARADGRKAEALKHYKTGKTAYNVHDWDEAIAEFKLAYKLAPNAVYLFNIAQAYRLEGDCENAAQFYASYEREEHDDKLRESTSKVHDEMEKCAREARASPPTAASAAITVADDPASPTTPTVPGASAGAPVPLTGADAVRDPYIEVHEANVKRRTGKILLFSGAGVIAVGLIWYGYATSIECKQFGDTGLCLNQARVDRDRHQAFTTASLLGGLGAASVVIGAVLYFTSPSPTHGVAIVPTANGAAVSWSRAF